MVLKTATVKPIALEVANGFIKAYDGIGEVVKYPNTVQELEEDDIIVSRRGVNAIHEYDGNLYAVGRTIGVESSSGYDVSKYKTENYLREALFALSTLVNDGTTIDLVTGLPSVHMKDSSTADEVIKRFKNKKFVVDGKRISIRNVYVLLQPTGAFFYSLVDENGEIDEDMFERFGLGDVMISDIGFGTTDVAIYRNRSKVRDFSVEFAIKDAILNLINKLSKEHPGTKFARNEVPEFEIERQIREGYESIKLYGEEIPYLEEWEEILRKQAGKILNRLRNKAAMDSMNTIIFAGGGTVLLRPYLEEWLKDNSGETYGNVFFSDESQEMNVKGFYTWYHYGREE